MESPLKSYRERNGKLGNPLPVKAAAERAGITPAMWSRWENRKREVPPAQCIRLEASIGVPRHELRPDLWAAQESVA